MLYYILKWILSVGIRLYYGKIEVENKEQLPDKGPIILAVNHPNTLVDAWLLGMLIKKPIYYMAKATFFKGRLKKRFLKALGMIPVARRGDDNQGADVDNKESFEFVYKTLEHNRIVLIFPEGYSYPERKLRPLKPGLARIVLEAERRNNYQLGIKILPIGLNYEAGHLFKSRILIKIGEPYHLKPYFGLNENSNRLAVKQLTTDLEKKMEDLIINIPSEEQDEIVRKIKSIVRDESGLKMKDEKPSEMVLESIEIKEKIDEIEKTNPSKAKEIRNDIELYYRFLKRLRLRSDIFHKNIQPRTVINRAFLSLLIVLIGGIIGIYGFIHNYIPAWVTDKIGNRITKEIEYYSSVKIIVGLIVFPLYYSIFIFLFQRSYQVPWIFLIYALSMPISGYFYFYYKEFVSIEWNRLRYALIWRNKKSLAKTMYKLRYKILMEVDTHAPKRDYVHK